MLKYTKDKASRLLQMPASNVGDTIIMVADRISVFWLFRTSTLGGYPPVRITEKFGI